ncbi:glycosyltransferase [bacterium]|nr:glycosyltransferase [bacterium]
MKIAIIHDWLITYRGGERVLEAILEIFPKADIFTLFSKGKEIPQKISSRVKGTSFLQNMPFISKAYRHYLPLMPIAIELFDLSKYDLVISTSHAVAKGVLIHPGTIHFSYIHSPMRYIWDRYSDYFGNMHGLKRWIMDFIFNYLRIWDTVSANRVDHFIANSSFVKKRIQKYYNRDSEIIFPPVDIAPFVPENIKKKDYYLVLSAFTPYKKIELAIEAFKRTDKKLIIAGSGSLSKKYRKLARDCDNISFVISPKDETKIKLYQEAIAFIFPGFEDFGMTMVESIASGTPVIAFGKGGALDIIKDGVNGILFEKQTVNSLREAIKKSENMKWEYKRITETAGGFKKEIFSNKIRKIIYEKSNKSI